MEAKPELVNALCGVIYDWKGDHMKNSSMAQKKKPRRKPKAFGTWIPTDYPTEWMPPDTRNGEAGNTEAVLSYHIYDGQWYLDLYGGPPAEGYPDYLGTISRKKPSHLYHQWILWKLTQDTTLFDETE